MGEDDGAKLVSSGSFKVDRTRALEKLKGFQLGNAEFGAFFWVRCAVASGAARFELDPGLGSFTVRFDGAPFTKQELADPYAGLFEADAPRRLRHLAYGLLWVMRQEPGAATLTSGPAGSRVTLTASALGAEAVAPSSDAGQDTVLAVTGLWLRVDRPWYVKEGEFRRLCAAAPCRLTVGGKDVSAPPPGASDLSFELPGARVRMRPAPELPNRRNAVRVHVDGVFVGEFHYSLSVLPAESQLDAGDLALDASQAAAVRDARLDALLDAVAAREKPLLERILDSADPGPAAAAAARLAGYTLLNDAAADLADPLLAKLWKARLFPGKRSFDDILRRPFPSDAEAAPEKEELAAFRRRVRPPLPP